MEILNLAMIFFTGSVDNQHANQSTGTFNYTENVSVKGSNNKEESGDDYDDGKFCYR